MHLFVEPDSTWQVEFDYAVTVLKDSMKEYDITRAKMVITSTHHVSQFMHTLS
jgi:hypothetical protein